MTTTFAWSLPKGCLVSVKVVYSLSMTLSFIWSSFSSSKSPKKGLHELWYEKKSDEVYDEVFWFLYTEKYKNQSLRVYVMLDGLWSWNKWGTIQ